MRLKNLRVGSKGRGVILFISERAEGTQFLCKTILFFLIVLLLLYKLIFGLRLEKDPHKRFLRRFSCLLRFSAILGKLVWFFYLIGELPKGKGGPLFLAIGG